jgi:hypothetical protein
MTGTVTKSLEPGEVHVKHMVNTVVAKASLLIPQFYMSANNPPRCQDYLYQRLGCAV